MPHQLKRITGRGDFHFITFTGYQRRKFLASSLKRNVAVQILAALRQRWHFALVGYALMPAAILCLAVGEPRDRKLANPSTFSEPSLHLSERMAGINALAARSAKSVAVPHVRCA